LFDDIAFFWYLLNRVFSSPLKTDDIWIWKRKRHVSFISLHGEPSFKEDKMVVKVFIKRAVPADKAKEMIPLFRQMRVLATNQSGYISGETLKSLDRPDSFLVISTWQSPEYWEKWLLNEERRKIQDKIDALLGGRTEYEMFHYGFGE